MEAATTSVLELIENLITVLLTLITQISPKMDEEPSRLTTNVSNEIKSVNLYWTVSRYIIINELPKFSFCPLTFETWKILTIIFLLLVLCLQNIWQFIFVEDHAYFLWMIKKEKAETEKVKRINSPSISTCSYFVFLEIVWRFELPRSAFSISSRSVCLKKNLQNFRY